MSSVSIRILRQTVRILTRAFGGSEPDLLVTPVMAGRFPARLYTSSDAEPLPPLLFFHGGGFVSCDLDTHDVVCRRLAAASGLRVLAVDYRLAPEHPAPAQIEDAIEACQWVLSQRDLIGESAKGIFIAGDSAGGYLALQCCAALNESEPKIIGQLLFYPLITMDAAIWAKPSWSLTRWIGRIAVSIIRRNLRDGGDQSAFNFRNMPRTIIVSGKMLDPVYFDNAAFVRAARSVGVSVEHMVFPRLFHGGLNMMRLSGSGARAVSEAGASLREWSNRDPSNR